jgi:carbon monoxide dehydrogenase subunit G
MSQRVERAITIRRPHEEVAEFVTDPHRLFEAIPGFARFSFVGKGEAEGEEEWDVFLEVGTLHVGGRVLVRKPSVNRLEWSAERGTRHHFAFNVERLGEHTRLTMTLEYSFAGILVARVTEFLGRGIAARHLEAGLEEVRHLLEYGDAVEPA